MNAEKSLENPSTFSTAEWPTTVRIIEIEEEIDNSEKEKLISLFYELDLMEIKLSNLDLRTWQTILNVKTRESIKSLFKDANIDDKDKNESLLRESEQIHKDLKLTRKLKEKLREKIKELYGQAEVEELEKQLK